MHLLLEPDRQADLFQLPEELVRGGDTQDRGEQPRAHVGAKQSGATLATRTVPEEVTADELLRERRATVGEMQPKPVAVPPRGYGVHHRLVGHAWQRAVLDAGVGEEVAVFGGQDRVAEDRRHFVVGDDAAVFPRQLDEDGAVSVVDRAGRRDLETDEALEIGQATPVEVDVMDEPDRRDQEQQRQERSRQDHAATRACEPQATDDRDADGRWVPGNARHAFDSIRRSPAGLLDLGHPPRSRRPGRGIETLESAGVAPRLLPLAPCLDVTLDGFRACLRKLVPRRLCLARRGARGLLAPGSTSRGVPAGLVLLR